MEKAKTGSPGWEASRFGAGLLSSRGFSGVVRFF
jgi:hypothetical protein